MKKRLLCLFLVLIFCLSLAPGVTPTARAAETPAATDNAVTLYADYGSGFEPLDTLYFEKSVTEQTVTVDRPITALRVVKGDCYELNLDQLTLDDVCPAGYERKLSATDNDLIEVEDSMDFALSGSGELVIAARAPVEVMGETCSFKFPQINCGPIVPGSFFYRYTPGTSPGNFADGDALTVPDGAYLFESTMCHPDSGHPDAPMDIYVADDGQILYVFFEAFIDNTFDHGKDFAGVHVKCGDTIKTYKVHTTEDNEYGRWWFGYTDSSDVYGWEHMCYVVEVPMADLETADGALALAFEYYGTAGYQGADLLAVAIDGTFLVSNAPSTFYSNYYHTQSASEYYPNAALLPGPGATVNAAGGTTAEGDWWITNNDGDFTLTLNNATLDTMSEATDRWNDTDHFAPLYTLGDLTIELAQGTTNTIINNAQGNINSGLDAYGQELIIQGAGTLNVSANWRPVSMNNTLTIRDGAQVNATLNRTHVNTAGNDITYTAVDVFGLAVDGAALTVSANVTVPDGSPDHVYVSGIEIGSTVHKLTVKNGAVVEASASGGNVSGGTSAISWYGNTVRLDLAGEPITIREGNEATTAQVKEQLTTEYVYYSTCSLPYVKLETTAPAYDLWVAGTRVTGANASDVLGDGKVSYNAGTKTLTLNGVTLTSGGSDSQVWVDGSYSDRVYAPLFSNIPGLTIQVTGENSLTSEGDPGVTPSLGQGGSLSCGLFSLQDLTFTGSGTLIATGGSARTTYGIFTLGDLTVGDAFNGTLNAVGGAGSSSSYGICGDKNITITGSGTVTAAGGDATASNGARSVGICCYDNETGVLTIGGSAKVTATAGKAETGQSYGVYAHAVKASGTATVTAAGGKAVRSSDGITTLSHGIEANTLEVSDSAAVTATGGEVVDGESSYGIYLSEKATISGGTLTAVGTGGATCEYSRGLQTPSNTGYGLYIAGGTVSLTGGPTKDGGYGFGFSGGDLSVTGGSLTAKTEASIGSAIKTYGTYNVTVEPAMASTAADGTGAVAYVAEDNGTYKWFQAPYSAPPSSGGGGTTTYPVTPPAQVDNADVTVSPKNAAAGQTVTVTVTPDEGYKADGVTVTDSKGNEIEVTDNGDGTYSFKMPASKVTVTPVIIEDEPVPLANRPFVDVPEGSWFYDAAYHCYDNGYFQGVDDTHFDPQGTMTRAMFATVLYRIAGEPAVTGENPFTDVEDDAWYTDAVVWAAGEGIIGGYGDGRFGTNDPVTREQMVTIFWRYNGQPSAESGDLSGFADADAISEWARDAFTWAVEAGFISGKGDGVLDPKGTATRAQVAQIVMNYDTMDEG